MKKIISILICLLLVGANFSDARATGYEDHRVRVGIFFGSTAKSSYTIGGDELIVYFGEREIWNTLDRRLTVEKAAEIYYGSAAHTSAEAAFAASPTVYYIDGAYYPASTTPTSGYTRSTQSDIAIRASSGKTLMLAGRTDQYIGDRDSILSLEGVSYRGRINFYHNGQTLAAINELGLDDYLKGVVAKEMPSSWHIEALKAQSVVARNYVLTNSTKHLSSGFHVCNTVHCQLYGGLSAETARTNQAVDETSGVVMYYDGQPAEGYFHSSSGGRTESSVNFWNEHRPYLVGVDDTAGLGSPHDEWRVELSANDIRVQLAGNAIHIGEIQALSITSVSENGRVLEMVIQGSAGSYTLKKDRIRTILGSSRVKSIFFTFENAIAATAMQAAVPSIDRSSLESAFAALRAVVDRQGAQSVVPQTQILTQRVSSSGKFVLLGRGYGHGVGMSQYGAKNLAEAGRDYRQILTHYFTGVTF